MYGDMTQILFYDSKLEFNCYLIINFSTQLDIECIDKDSIRKKTFVFFTATLIAPASNPLL